MQSRIIRSNAIAFLLLVGVVLSWACGGEQKKIETAEGAAGIPESVLAPVPTVEFTAPAAQPIASNEIIAYVKVREPQKFIDRLGNWASLFPVPMTPEALRLQLEQSGVNLDELREGGNFAMFFFNPGPTLGNMPMVGFVPAADGGSIAQAMRAQISESSVMPLGESLLFSPEIDALNRAQAISEDLAKTANASMGSDIQLYLNMDTIMKQYGETMRASIPMMQNMMAMAAMPQGQMAQAQQNLTALMTSLIDFLEQVQGVTILVDMGQDELEIASVVTAKADTTLSGMLTAEPVIAPDLGRFLPAENIMRAQMTYSDMGAMMDWYIDLMASALPPDSGVDVAKLREEFASIANIGRTDYAFGIGMQDDGSVNVQGIMKMDDTASMMKFMQEKISSFNEGVLHDYYKATGIEMVIQEENAGKEIDGHPVHQYDLTIKFDESLAATPEQIAMMEKIFGQMKMEVIEINPLLIYSLNQPVDSTVQALMSAQAGVSLESMKSYPAGGLFYMDMNFTSYLNAIKSILPEAQSMGMPALPEDLPPVMFNGRNAKGEGYYSMKIPRNLVQGVVESVIGATQMMPPGAPQPAAGMPSAQ